MAKKKYYAEKLEENNYDMKKTWTYLKEAICKNYDRSTLPTMFEVDNVKMNDPNKIAQSFNEFFSNVGPKVNKEVPTTNKKYTDYLENHPNNIFLNPMTTYDIITITNQLKPKNSCGYDDISTKLIKNVIN